jgi:hypothetical protein
MKLRIHKNTLRIRLDEDDLKRLLETGSVTEELRFGDGEVPCLIYSVETRDGTTGASAELEGGRIRVFIPPETARNLADETEVAVEARLTGAGSSDLELLVEKDFLP